MGWNKDRWGVRSVSISSIAAVLLIGGLSGCGNRWDDYSWTASSAFEGFPKSGTLRKRESYGLVFHTTEENSPSVTVDMLKERSVTRVVLRNRLDCCQDRGLPLLVELGTSPSNYVEVARRTAPFDTWEISVAPTQARYLRVRADRKTTLHLTGIEIP